MKKRWIFSLLLVVGDIVWILFASVSSYFIMAALAGKSLPFTRLLACWAAGNALLTVGMLLLLRLYALKFTSVGIPEAIGVVLTTGLAAVANVVFVLIADTRFTPDYVLGFAVAIVYCILLFVWLFISRFGGRLYVALRLQWRNTFTDKKRILVVGYNDDAFTLIRSMACKENSRYRCVGILEDDELFLGKRIYDVRVVGTTYDVKEVVKKIPCTGNFHRRSVDEKSGTKRGDRALQRVRMSRALIDRSSGRGRGSVYDGASSSRQDFRPSGQGTGQREP